MTNFPILIVRDHAELADAFWTVKNFRGLSNESFEELCGFTRGHVDKMLGPSREKSIGKNSLPVILAALGVRLVLIRDFQQEQLMKSRWELRNQKQIRVHAHNVSRDVLARAAPVIFRQHMRPATLARLTKLSPAQRSLIAKHAAKSRWKMRKHHGQIANGNPGGPRAAAKSKPAGAGIIHHRAARRGAVARPRAPRHRAIPAGDHRQ
jgi:hypothetical protein